MVHDEKGSITLKEFMDERFEGLQRQLSELTLKISGFTDNYVTKDVHDKDISIINEKLKEMQSWAKWLQMIVFGAVIGAILSLVIPSLK